MLPGAFAVYGPVYGIDERQGAKPWQTRSKMDPNLMPDIPIPRGTYGPADPMPDLMDRVLRLERMSRIQTLTIFLISATLMIVIIAQAVMAR